MGYTTNFYGKFKFSKPLSQEHYAYLNKFANTRHLRRNEKFPWSDSERIAVNLPIGEEAEYVVDDREDFLDVREFRQAKGKKFQVILDYNHPPKNQPGLYCQWIPNPKGTYLVWDGCEKFYNYIEWLQYLITHFLEPWGYKLNGSVRWQGERHSDQGHIVVDNNSIIIFTIEEWQQFKLTKSSNKTVLQTKKSTETLVTKLELL